VFGSCAVSPHSVLSEVPTIRAARSRCCRSATAGNPRIFSWITILDGAAMLALFSRPTAAGSGPDRGYRPATASDAKVV
jgi:hypothetical protein